MQLSDFDNLNNGAQFLNIDLHIHTFGGSADVSDPAMTPEGIVESAVKQGLHVIAITDHNSNKNVQAAIDYGTENHAGKILVLPGVEVTTSHGHLLVYFAPDKTAQLNRFLMSLDLIGEMGQDNTRTAKSMADAITLAYGLDGICIAAHIDRDRTGFDKFAPGFQNWKKDIICSPGLYGVECDALEALAWYSDEEDSSSDGVERRRMFKARRDVEALVARHHLAHVQGSDSHTMADFENADPKKPWTKMKLNELCFAALRVALIDPTARVRACARLPERIPKLKGIGFTGGFLHQEKIHFSSNLNCFIGGRGTGKSTAIRAVAYAFGLNEEFGKYENCPDSVTVYCEDERGILYRYVRTRNGEIEVKAKAGGATIDVPPDSFRIEYFGQGELAKVAEDPLHNPQLFQDFLDRHTNLSDLANREQHLISKLQENGARLGPIEGRFVRLDDKRKMLKEIETKLKVAEEGDLKGIVSQQSKLASEKAVRESLEQTANEYHVGWDLSCYQRDIQTLLDTAGTCTGDAESAKSIEEARLLFDAFNSQVKEHQTQLNSAAQHCSRELRRVVNDLKSHHQRMSNVVATQVAALKASGHATDMASMQSMLTQKTAMATEIAKIEQGTTERDQCRDERTKLRAELTEVREEMTKRRKAQLRGINANLGKTIRDYTVFVKYDAAGITDDFEAYLQEKLTGTYVQDEVIASICRQVSPSELADLAVTNQSGELSARCGVSRDTAEKIVVALRRWSVIFDLQALSKPPKPIITVRTKSTPVRDIAVFQLSDGQRHTILLTIAMLAETNVPLVIDQPEDDLDNAFIFTSIVTTLRSIKERRQVLLVTHNANIAVLGDSELLMPMCRENDCGRIINRGSIDSGPTKREVQEILEGGPEAFLSRKAIYGH